MKKRLFTLPLLPITTKSPGQNLWVTNQMALKGREDKADWLVSSGLGSQSWGEFLGFLLVYRISQPKCWGILSPGNPPGTDLEKSALSRPRTRKGQPRGLLPSILSVLETNTMKKDTYTSHPNRHWSNRTGFSPFLRYPLQLPRGSPAGRAREWTSDF